MAEFHFVEDYEKHVANLVKTHGLEEGMSLAVGGSYEAIGNIQAEILAKLGLNGGMRLADVGCGSGRTAAALSKRLNIEYDGFDIVQQLLDYAATKSPQNYRFTLNRATQLPSEDKSYDMVCAFSLFTHLLHEETFTYISDIFRTLKPGGTLVFSFLEFLMPSHWHIFESTVEGAKRSTRPHLNVFIERNVIELFSQKIGFRSVKFFDATTAITPRGALGQSIALLTKPL
jgi:ubiquinone/menaquinone biosynthesis C-methylase UbiE